MGDEQLSDYEQRYTVILQAGVEEERGAPGEWGPRPQTQSKSENLLDRLRGYRGRDAGL